MEFYKEKLTKSKGYFEGTLDAVDEKTALVAAEYKKNISKNFISINPEQIDSRVGGEEFYITKKYDGEMNVIFFNGEDAFIINTGGKVRAGIPCVEEVGRILKSKGIKSAIIPAELYVCEKDGRTRVFDVLSVLSKENEIGRLCLGPFDIVEIDGAPLNVKTYEDTYIKLQELFGDSATARQVDFKKASSKSEVRDIFKKWVEEQGAEGLIIRSELPMVYKAKPKHNIDVAIVGYTEGTGESRGQVRTLLIALMIGENKYQIIGRTGNGFSEEQKKEMLKRLSETVIESEYIETDSNHVAFRMVRPETVIEISFNDVLFENSTSRIANPVLELNNEKFKLLNINNGISLIYPIFVRIRDDKKADEQSVRMSQITDLIYIPDFTAQGNTAELPKSEVLLREVYKKETKGKLMVQKFLVWKTNKEQIDDKYPAYVMHYTNFSSDRKDPLQRDIRISNDRDQIFDMTREFIEENVKKGWVKV